MNKLEFKTLERVMELKPGDAIRHKTNPKIFVVTANYGDRVTAVASVDVTNPHEWEVLRENNLPSSPEPESGIIASNGLSNPPFEVKI